MKSTVPVAIAAVAVFVLSSIWYAALTPVEARVLGPGARTEEVDPRRATILLGLVLWTGFPVVLLIGLMMWHKVPTVTALLHAGLAGRASRCLGHRRAVATSGPPAYERDPRVDEYIGALPDWQGQLCQQLRNLLHAADPEITETIKRTVRPYFVLQGNVCALLAAKGHVNLFLYDGAIVPDPEGIITGGHDNKTARTISFHQDEPINAPP